MSGFGLVGLPPVVGMQRIVEARWFVVWLDSSGEMSVNARTSKIRESTKGALFPESVVSGWLDYRREWECKDYALVYGFWGG
ncbi:hypothetical protein AVEN_232253-1, partial [Araneus ventricosus]